MDQQLIIKVILIAVFAFYAVVMLRPARGSRGTAVRRLAVLGLFALAAISIAFPGLLAKVAEIVGVGRGTDLLLYGFIVVLVGHMLTTTRRVRDLERRLTVLARREAIDSARKPETE